MSRSAFTMAAAALAATASAAYSASSTNNVAMYWGQGSNVDLSIVCADPSIDIVNIAFLNEFPTEVGGLPKSNFANSCGTEYADPKTGAPSGFLNCPSFEAGIKVCKSNGKKVLLSLGGGYPTDYYLKDEVVDYFGQFLIDSFGPYKAGAKYRPFGNTAIDGFDFDLEANAAQMPNGDATYISKNYAALINKIKSLQASMLISSAPQCQVPDPRLGDVIKAARFDMIFTQFYNTDECSARQGVSELSSTGDAKFTFGTWADWLVANSLNKNVKLYMGLSASTVAANPAHYITPTEAYSLISKWKAAKSGNFGGVMLWANTQSTNNVNNCKTYHYWIKAILEKKSTASWTSVYNNGCSVSSSAVLSSTKASSSIRASSTAVSSSALVSSSAVSSVRSSSAVVSSSVVPSASKSSSVVPSLSSSVPTPTATIVSQDGTCGITTVTKDGVTSTYAQTCKGYNYGSCCSQYGYCGGEASALNPRELYCGTGCNPLYGDCDVQPSSSAPASSSVVVSSSAVSSVQASSSAVVSSSAVSSVKASSSAVVSSSVVSSVKASSSAAVSSSAVSSVKASSSAVVSSSAGVSSAASSSAVVSSAASSSVASSSVASSAASSSGVASSSAASSAQSVVSSAASSVYVARTSNTPLPTGGSSVYPTMSAPYPISNSSSSQGVYPPNGASTTPCSTTSKPVAVSSSPAPYYPPGGVSSSQGAYYPPAGASSTPCTTSSKPVVATSSKPSYPEYPVQSQPSYPVNQVSSKPSYPVESKPAYPQGPVSSATTTVVTTTYVDICETGLTTKTETITKTVCNKCTKPTEDSVTSVYVCKNCGPSEVTVTVTKPNTPATGVPAKPTGPVYGGDNKSQPPAQPSMPSVPTYGNQKPSQPIYSADVKKQNDATSTTVQIVYVTKTPVPVVPVSTMLYPSGPAKNATSAAGTGTGVPTKPTGTGVPTKPTYAPPQFTGAASRMGAGLTGVLAIAAGLLVL